MFVVFIVTVTIDLLLAVGIGMVMASFLFMQRMTQMQVDGIKTITNSEDAYHLSEEEANILDQSEGKIMLFHLTGPMSFSSAKAVVRRHASTAGYEIMLLDLTEVPTIDFTTSRALEDILVDTKEAGRRIFLVGAQQQVCDMLKKQGVTNHFKTGKMYKKRLDALLHARKILSEG